MYCIVSIKPSDLHNKILAVKSLIEYELSPSGAIILAFDVYGEEAKLDLQWRLKELTGRDLYLICKEEDFKPEAMDIVSAYGKASTEDETFVETRHENKFCPICSNKIRPDDSWDYTDGQFIWNHLRKHVDCKVKEDEPTQK